MARRKYLLIATALGVVAVVAIVLLDRAGVSLISRGPSVAVAVPPGLPDLLLPDRASYRQDDTAWASDMLGQSDDTMGGYGCTVTSVANAVSNLLHEEVSPAALNARMSVAGGYTDRGWLIWNSVLEATDGRIEATVYGSPSHDNMQACMGSGGYPVVKIMLGGIINHWVLVVGQAEGNYLIRDPLLGTPGDAPRLLSERADKIHALRCIRKVAGQDT